MTLVRTRQNPRERQVIILRFGLVCTPPLTQREIAVKLGISRSHVSRIENVAHKPKESLGLPLGCCLMEGCCKGNGKIVKKDRNPMN